MKSIRQSQLVHAETYAAIRRGKRPGACGLVNEGLRISGIKHVKNPMVPKSRFCPSTPLLALPALIEKMKRQEARRTGRRIRKDAQLVAGYIASYPDSMAELRADPNKFGRYQQWLDLAYAFVERRHGADQPWDFLHEDEAHPHLHWLLGPYVDPKWGLTIGHRHPGYAASRMKREVLVEANGGTEHGLRAATFCNDAYKAAMQAYDDDFYESVSKPMGMDRKGEFPRERRPRHVHLAIRAAEQEADRLRKETEELRAELERVKGLAPWSGVNLERRRAPRMGL